MDPFNYTGDPALAQSLPMPMAPEPDPTAYSEAQLLDLFDKLKRPAMDQRWVFEREWLRDIFYVLNRQWIYFNTTRREWQDKRLQKWVPRPVTNKMAEVTQAIRSMFASVKLGVVARPIGHDPKSVAASEISDQMSPLIHDEHVMDSVMREADFWFIVTGNAVLQLSWDRDIRFNKVFIQDEKCLACGGVFPPQAITQAGNRCPQCGATTLFPAEDPTTGKPQGQRVAVGRGKTSALSPFEYAYPPNITRWDELPYIIRMRWRDKGYYEANLPQYVSRINFEKSPSDRSLQIYKSLALANDVGTGAATAALGTSGSDTVEGVTEYELWMKPTPEFPDGLVLRVAGDKSPMLIVDEREGVPGPFPYKDIEGNPLFPFCHAPYEHVGGRLLGRSALAPLIQKQDQLNQLDSLIQLIVQRMANPVWIIPENAGIEHFTGEPGLVMKWNPLAAGGNAKPERIAGENVPPTLFQIRAQLLKDIEELAGTYDIIKGGKPAGVEAFSALQLLVERSQSRFTQAFSARGEMYRQWFGLALELERQFGPQERTWAVIGPNRGYTFRHFQNAQLQGRVAIQVEDGSNVPKTTLGKRAAIEQANQLRLIDPSDSDQRYAIMTSFGLADLMPSLNFHVQAALQVQDAFERWLEQPNGPPPLVVKPWFDPKIHWQERIKWLNTDRMRELIAQNPAAEQLITSHLMQLQMLMAPAVDPVTGQPLAPAPGGPAGPPPLGAPKPQGGAMAMHQSNRESGHPDTLPKGNAPTPNGMMGPV